MSASSTISNTAGDINERRAVEARPMVRLWLHAVILVLLVLVVVGGATRLTDSGLSITEWKPIHGVIPPLSVTEWQEEFDLYKRIPEYEQIKRGMSLDEFKTIYWWEWAHRLIARSVGIVFALPLVFFWVTGRLERRLRLPLVGILALGGLQGFIGWWMVSSGLAERTDVSQYRLATHLTLASIIIAAIAWVARGLGPASQAPAGAAASTRLAVIMGVLVLVQIYLGGLVAGLDAGLAYNTWPLMDGALVPGGLFPLDPAWINFFETPKLVQFTHRMSGYAVWALALVTMFVTFRQASGTGYARSAMLLFALVTLQAVIGIVTLLLQVPFDAALTHQGVAIVVLILAFTHWRAMAGTYPVNEKPA